MSIANTESKWFLLIKKKDYYPARDTGDWVNTYATYEEALTVRAALRPPDSQSDWGTIIDLRTWVLPKND